MSTLPQLGHDTPLCLYHLKEQLLNTLELTAAHIISSPPQPPILVNFFPPTSLSSFQFPLSALLSSSLLPSLYPFLHFSPFSPQPLPSPGGMRQAGRLAVCAAVMAWAPCWGSFDGVGDYSSCSLGRIRLSHSTSSSITCTYRRTHTGTHLKNNYTNISYSGICYFFPLTHFDVGPAVVIKTV